MQILVIAALLVAGVIHVLPLAGIIGADRIATLYGIAVTDPNMEILLRHRALLFGILGGFLCASAWIPAWRPLALAAGLISAVGFMLICFQVGGWNQALHRVLVADVVAVICLVVAAIVERLRPESIGS